MPIRDDITLLFNGYETVYNSLPAPLYLIFSKATELPLFQLTLDRESGENYMRILHVMIHTHFLDRIKGRYPYEYAVRAATALRMREMATETAHQASLVVAREGGRFLGAARSQLSAATQFMTNSVASYFSAPAPYPTITELQSSQSSLTSSQSSLAFSHSLLAPLPPPPLSPCVSPPSTDPRTARFSDWTVEPDDSVSCIGAPVERTVAAQRYAEVSVYPDPTVDFYNRLVNYLAQNDENGFVSGIMAPHFMEIVTTFISTKHVGRSEVYKELFLPISMTNYLDRYYLRREIAFQQSVSAAGVSK